MDFSTPQERALKQERTDSVMTLRSGPGAPIFESGTHTRIRRNPVRAFAAFNWPGGPREVFGQVRDVSLTGCLLKTESTIAPGTELSMSITVLGTGSREPIEVRGVLRRRTTSEGRQAYGVEFLSSTSAERQALQVLYSQTA